MTMQITNVVTIFKKELIDTLRDRRTLIFMLLIPLVAIPALMMGMSKLMISQISKVEQESSSITIVGRDRLPDDFDATLTATSNLVITTDSTGDETELTAALTRG
jgi:ABC-type Na+ efflux pump permease subunit